MEEAFLWFEIQVMELGDPENVVDSPLMIVKIGASSDTNVVHIDANGCSKWFVLENDITVYVVHHGLESCW